LAAPANKTESIKTAVKKSPQAVLATKKVEATPAKNATSLASIKPIAFVQEPKADVNVTTSFAEPAENKTSLAVPAKNSTTLASPEAKNLTLAIAAPAQNASQSAS